MYKNIALLRQFQVLKKQSFLSPILRKLWAHGKLVYFYVQNPLENVQYHKKKPAGEEPTGNLENDQKFKYMKINPPNVKNTRTWDTKFWKFTKKINGVKLKQFTVWHQNCDYMYMYSVSSNRPTYNHTGVPFGSINSGVKVRLMNNEISVC